MLPYMVLETKIAFRTSRMVIEPDLATNPYLVSTVLILLRDPYRM